MAGRGVGTGNQKCSWRAGGGLVCGHECAKCEGTDRRGAEAGGGVLWHAGWNGEGETG